MAPRRAPVNMQGEVEYRDLREALIRDQDCK